MSFALGNRGKNQAWFANKVGKDEGQVSKYLNGKTLPYKSTQLELCDALGVEINELEDGTWELVDPLMRDPITQKTDLLEEMINDEGVDYRSQVDLIGYLQGRAESLSKELSEISFYLKRLHDSIKKQDADD